MSRIVLDVETQFFGNEVPRHANRVAVAGFLDLDRGSVYEFVTEDGLAGLFERMDAANLVVGHNVLTFDYAVLDPHLPGGGGRGGVRRRYEEKTLDTLADLRRRHGRRLSLDALADATLARRKVRTHPGVPELWKRGRVLEVVERNRSDVELTRDVYEFGRRMGYVGVRDPDGAGFVELEVTWP